MREKYNEKKKLFSNFHSISLFKSFNEVNEKTIILYESFNGENKKTIPLFGSLTSSSSSSIIIIIFFLNEGNEWIEKN